MSKKVFTLHSDNLRAVMLEVWNYVCSLLADEPCGLEISVKTVSLRSAQASALMWIRLKELEKQTDWHGIKLSDEDWKDLLSAGLSGASGNTRVVPNIFGNGFVTLGQRTSKFSIKKMNDMITLIEAFGSERGVRFSADPRIVDAYENR